MICTEMKSFTIEKDVGDDKKVDRVKNSKGGRKQWEWEWQRKPHRDSCIEKGTRKRH